MGVVVTFGVSPAVYLLRGEGWTVTVLADEALTYADDEIRISTSGAVAIQSADAVVLSAFCDTIPIVSALRLLYPRLPIVLVGMEQDFGSVLAPVRVHPMSSSGDSVAVLEAAIVSSADTKNST